MRSAFGGKAEVLVSLRTASIAEARHKLQRELDRFEKAVADRRGEVAPAKIAAAHYQPAVREIEAAVRTSFAERLERIAPVNRANREAVLAAMHRLEDLKAYRAGTIATRQIGSDGPTQDTIWMAEALCERHGWLLDENSDLWWSLIDLVARAQIEAAEKQLQMLRGDPQQTIDAGFSPEQFLRDAQMREKGELRVGAPVSLTGLFDKYVKERKPTPATVKSFGSKVRAFVAFLEHDDARRIAKSDVARWKEHLLEKGSKSGGALNPRSVRETFLAAVRTVLELGVSNGDLTENPASGVKVLGSKRARRLRPASFTDAEATLILRATLAEHGARLSAESKLARRWVPWICAYTGARVNEITQLRAEDIAQIDDVWTIRITPEAGGTKDGNARLVALHPHLIEQGMLNAFRGKKGHLFFDPARRRGGSDQNPQAKKVGEHLARWVRGLGIEKGVQPNHAWRHRFKTVARNCRMSEEVRDYIQGHVPRTEGESYGEITPGVLLREVELMPRYEIA